MASTEPVCAGYLTLRDREKWVDESVHQRACHGSAVFHSADGNTPYCVLHAPDPNKTAKFNKAVQDKLATRDYYFPGTWFPADANLSGHKFEDDADFRFAEFNGKADFSETQFLGYVNFTAARFRGGLSFERAHFGEGETEFIDAVFGEATNFQETLFGGQTDFTNSQFNGPADFRRVRFADTVTFVETKFNTVDFRSVVIDGSAEYTDAEFNGSVNFFRSSFNGPNSDFLSVKFKGDAFFDVAEFSGGDADFTEAEFSDGVANFWRVKFTGGKAIFDSTKFNGTRANFYETEFMGGVDFGNSQFKSSTRFSRVKFSKKTSFRGTEFNDEVYFNNAEFSAAASFARARFDSHVFFRDASFQNQVSFERVAFEGPIDFSAAQLNEVDFSYARFVKPVDFESVQIIEKINFSSANIGDRFNLNGRSVKEVEFKDVEIGDPEKLSLRNTTLRPSWFVRTDIRKVNFFNIRWGGSGPEENLASEIEELKEKKNEDPHLLLARVYRQIATNAEDDQRYIEAMKYRYLSLELHRRESWSRRYLPMSLHWWYWFSSGYGERSLRAFFLLLGIWFTFSLFYFLPMSSFYRWETKVSNSQEYQAAVDENKIDAEGRELKFTEAFVYSFGVMALQKPDPKPLGAFTYGLVLFETVLGPLQAALLALAIRRKFMR